MKKIWAVRKDSEAVSPVIATILMVAITVVLAAVLYVMVLGFGADTTQTPTTTLSKMSVTDGWRLTIGQMTDDVSWDSVNLLVIAGDDTYTWTGITATALTNSTSPGSAQTVTYAAANVGSLAVTLKILDLSGNGKINGGDYLELTASSFSSSVTYEVRLMYEPTSQPMATSSFSG
jgi:flagellin-like protein